MLEIDIKKKLRDFDLRVQLDIARGKTLMLVGDNGCGKTTLLNLVAGLDNPDKGRIALDGRVLYDSDNGINVPPEARGIGYVFQSYALFPHMSVYDNVAFGLRTRRMAAGEIKILVQEHLEAASLWEIRKAKAADISGGQKQRIAIARALITHPRILIFDEATSSLDYESEKIIQQNINKIKTGRTMFIVAHRLSTVKDCDLIIALDKGKIIETGTHEMLMAKKGYYHHLYTQQEAV